MNTKLLERWITPLKRRVMLMIGKAVLTVIKDSTDLQTVQINLGNDEIIDDVECMQNFGFTSNPEAGAQAIVLFVGGNRDHPVVITADDARYRPKNLDSGDSAMYNSTGTKITLEGNKVIIDSAGDIELGSGVLQTLVNSSFLSTIYDLHTHICAAPGVASATPLPVSVSANLTSKTKAE